MPTKASYIINWGNPPDRIPYSFYKGNIYICNSPIKSNKLDQLRAFTKWNQLFPDRVFSIPEFTTSKEEASTWEGTIVNRTLLNASQGRGIVFTTKDNLVDAPLYVKYIKKKREFRVHVVDSKVIDVQEKRLRTNFEGVRDNKIRNLNNGYVFCRSNIELTPELEQAAIRAVSALKINFGAVDIIYNEHYDKYYVLEVNSAPGLMGETVSKYGEALCKYLGKIVLE